MKRGAHYHCPVNGWSCPYYKNNEIIEGEEEFCLCKSPAIPMRNAMTSSLYSVKAVNLMITPIIAKKITKNKD